jgi:hypothetical protein
MFINKTYLARNTELSPLACVSIKPFSLVLVQRLMYVCVLLVRVVCLSHIGREQQDP